VTGNAANDALRFAALALGIRASTAIFTVSDGIVLAPLPPDVYHYRRLFSAT